MREVILMFEAEFGESCVEVKMPTGIYRQGKVTWDTHNDLAYGHEQKLPYKEDEIVSQLQSVYWMVIGKEPSVNRISSQRGNSAWRFTVEQSANEPRLEMRISNSGAIWFWVMDPSYKG